MRLSQFLFLALLFISIGLFSSCQEEEANYNFKRIKQPITIYQSDRDKDKVPDSKDNCPNKFNPKQEDQDGDGIGDGCDINPERPDKPDTEESEDEYLDSEDCDEESCYEIPDFRYMTMMVRRPKPCDTGVCLEQFAFFTGEEVYFNPAVEHVVQVIDPQSRKVVTELVTSPSNEAFTSLQFKLSEEVSSSFETLVFQVYTNTVINRKATEVKFEVVITGEGIKFP